MSVRTLARLVMVLRMANVVFKKGDRHTAVCPVACPLFWSISARSVIQSMLALTIMTALLPVSLRAADDDRKREAEIEKVAAKVFAESFPNYIAIRTGTLKSGEQIPLPVYGDGKQAKRKECYYMVSAGEVTTAFPHLGYLGVYFLRCSVDSNGFVNVSLWQHGGDGRDLNLSNDASYENLRTDLDAYYASLGTQQKTEGDFLADLMGQMRKRAVVNYQVIAVKSKGA